MSFKVLSDQTAGIAAPGANTDFLAADVSINPARHGCRIRWTIVSDTAAAFRVVDDNGTVYALNGVSNLEANAAYVFDLPASSERTYNLQTTSGTAAITSLLVEEVWDE